MSGINDIKSAIRRENFERIKVNAEQLDGKGTSVYIVEPFKDKNQNLTNHQKRMEACVGDVAPESDIRFVGLSDYTHESDDLIEIECQEIAASKVNLAEALNSIELDNPNLSDTVVSMSLGLCKAELCERLFTNLFRFTDGTPSLLFNGTYFSPSFDSNSNLYQRLFGDCGYSPNDIISALETMAKNTIDQRDVFALGSQVVDWNSIPPQEAEICRVVLNAIVAESGRIFESDIVVHAQEKVTAAVKQLTDSGAVVNIASGNQYDYYLGALDLGIDIPVDYITNSYASAGMHVIGYATDGQRGISTSFPLGNQFESLDGKLTYLVEGDVQSTSEATALASGMCSILKQHAKSSMGKSELDELLVLIGDDAVTTQILDTPAQEQGYGIIDFRAMLESTPSTISDGPSDVQTGRQTGLDNEIS